MKCQCDTIRGFHYNSIGDCVCAKPYHVVIYHDGYCKEKHIPSHSISTPTPSSGPGKSGWTELLPNVLSTTKHTLTPTKNVDTREETIIKKEIPTWVFMLAGATFIILLLVFCVGVYMACRKTTCCGCKVSGKKQRHKFVDERMSLANMTTTMTTTTDSCERYIIRSLESDEKSECPMYRPFMSNLGYIVSL